MSYLIKFVKQELETGEANASSENHRWGFNWLLNTSLFFEK